MSIYATPLTLEQEIRALRSQVQELEGALRRSKGSVSLDNSRSYCFFCGQIDIHSPGLRYCSKINDLLQGGLIYYDPRRSQYVLPNGDNLPKVPRGWVGGVASYIQRHLSNSVPSSSRTNTTNKASVQPSVRNSPDYSVSSRSSQSLTSIDGIGHEFYCSNSTIEASFSSYESNPSDYAGSFSTPAPQSSSPINTGVGLDSHSEVCNVFIGKCVMEMSLEDCALELEQRMDNGCKHSDEYLSSHTRELFRRSCMKLSSEELIVLAKSYNMDLRFLADFTGHRVSFQYGPETSVEFTPLSPSPSIPFTELAMGKQKAPNSPYFLSQYSDFNSQDNLAQCDGVTANEMQNGGVNDECSVMNSPSLQFASNFRALSDCEPIHTPTVIDTDFSSRDFLATGKTHGDPTSISPGNSNNLSTMDMRDAMNSATTGESLKSISHIGFGHENEIIVTDSGVKDESYASDSISFQCLPADFRAVPFCETVASPTAADTYFLSRESLASNKITDDLTPLLLDSVVSLYPSPELPETRPSMPEDYGPDNISPNYDEYSISKPPSPQYFPDSFQDLSCHKIALLPTVTDTHFSFRDLTAEKIPNDLTPSSFNSVLCLYPSPELSEAVSNVSEDSESDIFWANCDEYLILTLPLSISCSSFRNLTLVNLPYAISLQTFTYLTLYCGTTTEFCDLRLLETDSKFIIGFCIAWSVQPAISFEIHGANHRVHRRLLPCAGPYSPDMCQLSLVCSSVFAFFVLGFMVTGFDVLNELLNILSPHHRFSSLFCL